MIRKTLSFVRDSYREMHEKVTWPTWTELQNSATIVLVSGIIIALIVLFMDETAGRSIKMLYQSLL